MSIDRRTMLGGALAVGAGLWAGTAKAAIPASSVPLVARMMASIWIGYSNMSAEFVEGGVLHIQTEMQFSAEDDWSFTGRCFEQFSLEGGSYGCLSGMRGRCYAGNGQTGVIIDRIQVESGDSLPNGMSWGSGSSATLALSNHPSEPGRLVLTGKSVGLTTGAASTMQLIGFAG